MTERYVEPINESYDEAKAAEVIADAIEEFYASLVKGIDEITIDKILGSKNPYLYCVKNVKSPRQFVGSILDAYISSSEETIFGNLFFEPLAIAVSGGSKAGAEGVDIEIDAAPIRYAIAVKSGTSVFNADSKKRQIENFDKHARLMRQGGLHSSPVIGYGYGTKKGGTGGRVLEYAGQDFWEYLTGDPDFYTKIVDLMGDSPEVWSGRFEASKAKTLDRLTGEFAEGYVAGDGSIDWHKVLRLNSGSVGRKEREELDSAKALCLELMRDDGRVSKKRLCEAIGCSQARLNAIIGGLRDEGAIEAGCDRAPWRLR